MWPCSHCRGKQRMQSYSFKYCKLQHLVVVVITAILDTHKKNGNPCFWQESNLLLCSAADTGMHPYSSKHVWHFFIIKPTRWTNFTNFFWHETLHVSEQFLCPSSGVNSLYTQQWYMFYRFVDSFRAGPGWNWVPSWSCSKAVYKPVWHIPLLSVQWMNYWWWTEELFWNM